MNIEIIIYDHFPTGNKLHPMLTEALQAVQQLNISADIKFISDPAMVKKKMITELPVLFIDGVVRITGRLGLPNEIYYLLLYAAMYEKVNEDNLMFKIAIQ